MGLVPPISAINSWEGYKYQGNIALFVVLSHINNILLEGNSLEGYEIQIEGVEDFALLKDGNYNSLHQVKLGEINLDNNDKFVFIAEIIQNKAEKGYFHVKSSKSIPNDFLNKACSEILKLSSEFQKPIVSKADLSASDNSEDYIVLEFVTSNKKKGTKYSIIKHNIDGKSDRNSVENAIKNIKKELKQYLKIIKRRKHEFLNINPNKGEDKCFIEEYPIKFDNIKVVKENGVQIIKEIVMHKHPHWTFADNKYCTFLYEQGIRLIEQYVTDFFIQKNKNGKCLITYKSFYEVIVMDYYSNFGENKEFKYYYMIQQIENGFIDFRNNICNKTNCEQCINAKTCNLWKQIKEMLSMDIEKKHNVIFNLLLQEPTVDINNLPRNETIHIQFLEMLKDLSALTLNEKNIISALLNKEFYWLSLDESRRNETLRKKIQKGIRESHDKSFLYECDTLITGFLNDDNFKIDGSNVNVLENEQLKEIKNIVSNNINDEKANCNKPKIIRLINTENAKKELL